LLGVGGGVVAAAGAATAIALLSDRRGTATAGGGSGSPSPVVRPNGADVPEAKPSWQATQQTPSPQVLAVDGVTVCVSVQHIWGLDDTGRTKWTVDGGAFAIDPNTPRPVAGTDAGRLVVAEWAGLKTDLLSLDPADGRVDWRFTRDQKNATGVTSFAGVRSGKAYFLGSGDGQDRGLVPGGSHVWAVDLAARRTAWFHGEDTLLVQSALLPDDDRVMISNLDQLKVLDATGAVVWTRKLAALGIAAAGGHFLAPDADGKLTALNPDDKGSTAWTADGVVGGSIRGGGFAGGEDGKLLHCLWKDADGGYSVGTLDPANGRNAWRTPLPPDSPEAKYLGARLLYADGNLYRMGADAVIWALDPANGAPRWKYSGLKGKDPVRLAWSAGAGRLCVSDTTTQTITAVPAKGA
ncbi:PQQ-binding-like beta-propeller repeat protein, partial [Kitasatospora sp. NPDC127111]|uniref:outer membrane protein assembly factor BamB family protein n=1 Tax=Kitasatospora sp. NPDC127111 TaxID=3345363 RepID=UPI00363F1FB6